MITFCFPDIETTGVDENDDIVLEVAWAFTDEHFEVLGTPRTFVVKPQDYEWQSIAAKLRENPVVGDMHKGSGLWADLASATTDIWDISEVFAEDLRQQQEVGATIHLAGLSVEFDRAFLKTRGFDFEKLGVHHRLYNLSAVKMGLENVGVMYEKAPNDHPHRALPDVFEAIEQARIFRRMLAQIPAV